jgi:hypothetical protein
LGRFCGFLHKNSGAREVWTKREEELNSYLEKLEIVVINAWYRDIKARLEALDKERK